MSQTTINKPAAFSVNQEQYQGPLETIIYLLRKRKLHVSDVNLAQITDEFSDYIQQSDNSMSELSDFVRVMSVLLLIKAKALLPNEQLGNDDEETIAQFEADLIRIELLQEISSNLLGSPNKLLSRIERPKSVPHKFIPDDDLSIDKLAELAQILTENSDRDETFAKVAVAKLANLKTTIETIERRLIAVGETDFKHLIPNDMTTSDKVVHFIAILELLKQNKLMINEVGDQTMLQYGQINTPQYGIKSN